MSDHETNSGDVPKGPLWAAISVVIVAVVLVIGAQQTDRGTLFTPEPTPLETRELVFKDRGDGAVVVEDAGTRAVVAVLPPGGSGFVRGTLRALARERRQNGVGQEPPFTLIRGTDGKLTLQDPETGRRLDLGAFGPTNAGAFAQLFIEGRQTR